MVKLRSQNNRPRSVLLSSIITSILLAVFFLFGAISINIFRGKMAYTQIDMAAGSFFVFAITFIISLSLWPKAMDWLEKRKKSEGILK
jgi:hypothetical protein